MKKKEKRKTTDDVGMIDYIFIISIVIFGLLFFVVGAYNIVFYFTGNPLLAIICALLTIYLLYAITEACAEYNRSHNKK